jgi:hypothetical protein
MLWLLQCLDGESSSGEFSVPQIRSIGQFLLSRLFSSLNSSVLRSGILDWLLWIIDMLDLLAQPYNSRPYVQIGMIMVL